MGSIICRKDIVDSENNITFFIGPHQCSIQVLKHFLLHHVLNFYFITSFHSKGHVEVYDHMIKSSIKKSLSSEFICFIQLSRYFSLFHWSQNYIGSSHLT
ncbi:hypothetical protein BpHYR1_046497 [Brachionus plicatilis]|uniref:Uncharacterized protein n=1 Tax=Brachionus plicatilis TaxID=10195 RepID=A0A3M7QQJ2_BRAPC|nr:hypothetical protein BpHYR1_046497 [Brachionus plicatilis]